MARNPKVELRGHEGQVVHPITDGDCVIFPSGETLSHKLSEQEEVMYAPEVTNSSPMFKVGEGDSSDYSANVLDGAYQEAVLKGQTYVNTIQEPSADVITLPTPFTEYERTQSKTFTEMQDGTFGLNLVGQSYVNCIQEPSEPSYVALGENLEFQNKKVEYTTDGQIKSATLNGMTLVNVFQFTNKNDFANSNEMIIEGTAMKFNANGTYQNFWLKNNGLVKANADYLFIVDVLENTLVYKDDVSDNSNIVYLTSGSTGYSDSSFFPSGVNMTAGDLKGARFIKKFTSYPTSTGTEDILLRSFLGSGAKSGTLKIKIMLMEYQEGLENIDIPYFQGMQSVTMTTELENVCSRYNSSGAKNGKTFTVGTANDRRMILSDSSNIAKYEFKQNMKYLMQFKITNLNLDGEEYIKLIFSDDNVSSGDALFGDNASTTVKITKNGIYRTVLTTSTVIDTSIFVIKGLAEQWEDTTSTSRRLTISQIMCIEYQNGMENWDLPYFETTQLMKPFKVRTMSKNLCPVGKGQFFNCFFKAGTQFTLSTKDGVASNGGNIMFKDKDGNSMWLGINSGTSLARTTLAKDVYQIVNQLNSEVIQYQLEEGATATDYVVHQEKTISALEPITLRAIGDVKDTLDLSTGEYVQRIGEIVLDANTDKTILLQSINDNGIANFWIQGITFKADTKNICDKLIKQETVIADTTSEGFLMSNTNTLYIRLLSSKASTVNEFKTWLQTNPLKFQYELENPITRKISLEYPNLQTYTDITHVQSIAMDGTLIPNIFLPSDISYKAMLKPNTSYNVIVDREVIDSTNQLTVNLGGTTANITANRTVVTTPSTLSNETLTFSGKDNRIAKAMLIEGSTLINGDLPHFDGIGDVKLGRVVENLCMSNESFAGGATVTSTLYTDRIELKVTKDGSSVECFRLNKQLINGKKYFVYSPSTTSNTTTVPIQVGFKHFYNDVTGYGRQPATMPSTGKLIFTMDENYQINPYTDITIGNHGSIPVNTTMTIRRPILCEYIDGMENWDWESIGYFAGTRNIGNEFMRIGNKNLFDKDYSLLISSDKTKDIGNDTIEFYQNDFRFYISPKDGKFKENTQYTLSFQKVEGTCLFYVTYTDGTTEKISNTTTTAKNKTIHMIRSFYNDGSKSVVKNIQLEEASSATSYVAHKHNSLHILPNEQIPLTFEQGAIMFSNTTSFAEHINNTMTTRIRTGLLDLEPNETYRISFGDKNYICGIAFYDNSNIGFNAVSEISKDYVFTTTKNVHKMCINIARSDMDANITPSVLHQVRLEKVTDVHLRSVGDVKDELDLTRGVYIQRMHEVTLDGTGIISLNSPYSTDNTICFDFYYNAKGKIYEQSSAGGLICDKFIPRNWLSFYNSKIDEEGIVLNRDNGTVLLVKIAKSKLATENVDGFKAYLQQNPITVQYELETPIEHKINIPMKNELNQTIAKPNGIFTLPLMYSETNHIDINSQIYPKVQSRDYISYPVIANNSQLHTVFHNKLGTGNLTVNLCGTNVTSVDGTSKCTITTPSTISQYELRLSGARNKVSNVCVFSGDYMNVNVPYVQGMMNAVNPIVKNVGKNLLPNNNFYEKMFSQDKDGVRIINQTNRAWCYMFHNNIAIPLRRGTYIYTSQLVRGTFGGGTIKFIFSDGTETGEFWNFNNGQKVPHKIVLEKDKVLTGVYMWNPTGDFVIQLQLEESPTLSQYEPYKQNILKTSWSIGYNAMLKDKSISSSNGTSINNALNRYRTDFIKIDFAKIYINSNNPYCLFLYDINKKYLGRFTDSWVTDREFEFNESNAYYFIVVFKTDDGEDTTTYISSKETRITLRSLPNGVRDELNLQTGEYIQRIGEIVLDGNIDPSLIARIEKRGAVINNKTALYTKITINEATTHGEWVTNTTPTKFTTSRLVNDTTNAYYALMPNTVAKSDGTIQICIDTDLLEAETKDGVIKYLSENPVTYIGELKTPIVKQVDINNFPHSYKDGHVIIENNDPSTNVTAQMTYQCVANRTGQIQEHTEQVEKQERQINELETLILENIRQQQNR